MFGYVTEVFLLPPETAPAPGSGPQTNWSRIRAVKFYDNQRCALQPCTDPNAPEPWDGTNCSTNQVIGVESCADSHSQYVVPELCKGCCAGCPDTSYEQCQNATEDQNTTQYTGYCQLASCEIFPGGK